MSTRLATGGRLLNKSKALSFSFNGTTLKGFETLYGFFSGADLQGFQNL